MAPSTALWNPSQVLRLGPYSPKETSTCIGHAPSKNRRCRNPIAAANQQEAKKLLDRIGSTNITRNVDLTEELEEVAARLLCRRWHQNQAPVVARKWMEEVEKLKANAGRGRRQAVAARGETDVAAVTTKARTPKTTSMTTGSTTTGSTTTAQRVAAAARTTASPPASSPPRATPAVLTETSPTQRTLLSPPRPTLPTSAAPPPPACVPPPSSPPAPPLATPTCSPSFPSLTPPPTPSSSDPQPPANPLSSAEECPICYDDVADDEKTTLNCKHSFHTVCITTWFRGLDRGARRRSCPYCRRDDVCE